MEVLSTNIVYLHELYKQVHKKSLVLPLHQRNDAWPEDRIQEWHERIKLGGFIPGLITTYRLKDEDRLKDPSKLNDGAQQVIFQLEKFKDKCASDKEFEDYLRECKITQQDVIYDDMQEAIKEFFALNAKGTTCTPFELTKGIFVSKLSSYEIIWAPIFSELHEIISACLTRVGCKLEKNLKREMLQTMERRLFYFS